MLQLLVWYLDWGPSKLESLFFLLFVCVILWPEFWKIIYSVEQCTIVPVSVGLAWRFLNNREKSKLVREAREKSVISVVGSQSSA